MTSHSQNCFKHFFSHCVADINAALERSRTLHKLKDIKSSGNELEAEIRNILHQKLPDSYHIGHGHIIDNNGRYSPQFDLIIADKNMSPVLFKGSDGTEFFLYESIYCIGEIKASYKLGYIKDFINNIKRFKSLVREQNFVVQHPYDARFKGMLLKNEVFHFILFLDAKKIGENTHRKNSSLNNLKKLLAANTELSPNAIVFFDKGVICNAKIAEENHTEIYPSAININNVDSDPNKCLRLRFIQPDTDRDKTADSKVFSFSTFYSLLMTHLSSTCLLRPNISKDYMRHFSSPVKSDIIL